MSSLFILYLDKPLTERKVKILSKEDIRNYFQIQKQPGAIQTYNGNPDYALGSDYEDVTLDSLGINIELIKNELMGMERDLVDPVTNEPYPDSFYKMILNRVVAQAEKIFDVAIVPRLQVDRLDYHRSDFNAFAYLHTTMRPILSVKDLLLYYNNQDIMHIPDEWIKVTNRTGQLQVSPSVLMQGLNTTINPTVYPLINSPYGMTPSPFTQMEFAPQMLGVTYVAGMMPHTGKDGVNYDWMIQPDMLSYIAKLGAVEILEKWSRNIVGAGIASYSVSVDGISTSLNTTASAENSAATAEVDQMVRDMKPIEQRLLSYYGNPEIGFLS